MKINSEDALLARLVSGLPVGEGLVVGPGDDCAVVSVPGGKNLLLLKTDCVVEDVHFLRSHDPSRVGWKALCRPLSDIAAMGGTPGQALVTIFSPPDIPPRYWEKFYNGLSRAARRFRVGIAGGEISRQPMGISVSIALTGSVPRRLVVRRSGGQPGDVLFVTGKLGGSMAGHHLDFFPRLPEGRWLATHIRPHAMMDLSDGLGSDLPRLARASGCGFVVDFEALPRNRGADISAAITDGEDYELLFAVPERAARKLQNLWKQEFPKVVLSRIGELTAVPSCPPNWPGGWDHFSVVRTARDGEPPDVGRPASRQRRS